MKENRSEGATNKVKLTDRLMILSYAVGKIEENKSVSVPREVKVKTIEDHCDLMCGGATGERGLTNV